MPDERPRRLILLGATGSIGQSTLEVLSALDGAFELVAVSAGSNAAALREIGERFGVSAVALADPAGADELSGFAHVHTGCDGAERMIEEIAQAGDLCLVATVGAAGVRPTLAAIARGCDIALANKETLVAAGAVVMPAVSRRDVRLLPVDSEHSAIAQCLRSGRNRSEVRRVVLTASGGPFRSWSRERIAAATPEEALRHPTWSMGPKITIDSATLMNKALEVIEAHWLFDLPADCIDVVVHPASIVHSFVEFIDGSVVAQLGPPDMRTPIQYALTWPRRQEGPARRLDFTALRSLEFEPVDHDRFPALQLADRAIRAGGTSGAVLNAANEEAVEAFLDHRIAFPDITIVVAEAMDAVAPRPAADLDVILEADAEARSFVRARVGVTVGSARPAAAETVRQDLAR